MIVEVVHTFNPSNQTVEDYKYPRPGSTNAPSTLRLLEFTLDQERKVRIFQVPDWCPKLRYHWIPVRAYKEKRACNSH